MKQLHAFQSIIFVSFVIFIWWVRLNKIYFMAISLIEVVLSRTALSIYFVMKLEPKSKVQLLFISTSRVRYIQLYWIKLVPECWAWCMAAHILHIASNHASCMHTSSSKTLHGFVREKKKSQIHASSTWQPNNNSIESSAVYLWNFFENVIYFLIIISHRDWEPKFRI